MRRRFASGKFAVPPVPRRYIARSRLDDVLNRAVDQTLTTVVGAPGSGKTVAVASWLSDQPGAKVWMTCDARDSTAETFWAALVEGLTRVWPDRWIEIADLVDEDRPHLADVAIALANEMETLGEPLTLVVDDFHLAREAAASVAVLVDVIPPSIHLVLVSRADPAFPVHQLRLRGELLELREDDLRLSAEETDALAEALDLELDGDTSRLLHERTNGWLAAVHLAALSMRGREDAAPELLREFSGENRLMAEFLLGEVLSQQGADVRRFLEESSVLDELDAPACRAVTGVDESDEVLRVLSTENMLVVRRGEGASYEYHQLFRDLLQYRLRANSPERFAELHRQAAHWYEALGEFDRAVAHLTIAGDDQDAYALVGGRAFDVLVTGGTPAMDRLIAALDLRRAVDEPSRAIDVALALGMAGAIDEAERWVLRFETTGTALSTSDASRLAAVRALIALLRGDPEGCETALDEVTATPTRDAPIDAAGVLAIRARLWFDDTAGARRAHDTAVREGHTALEYGEVMLAALLASTVCVEGGLSEAEYLADDTLKRAEKYGLENHPMVFEAWWTHGQVAYERALFDDAETAFERAIAVSDRVRLPFVMLGQVGLARLWIAQRRLIEAAAALEQARAIGEGFPAGSPLLSLVTECEARLALATGDLERATALANTVRPSDRRNRLEATVALAAADPRRALTLVAETQAPTLRQRLDNSVLRTRALHSLGDEGSDAVLAETVSLAREEGFIVALTHDMPELDVRLSFLLRSGPVGPYEQSVLDHLDRPRAVEGALDMAELIEPLSTREQTVLRYLDSRLSLREIAEECYVSPNTIKTQTKAVYRKLGVSSRHEAVAEARRLQLL